MTQAGGFYPRMQKLKDVIAVALVVGAIVAGISFIAWVFTQASAGLSP